DRARTAYRENGARRGQRKPTDSGQVVGEERLDHVPDAVDERAAPQHPERPGEPADPGMRERAETGRTGRGAGTRERGGRGWEGGAGRTSPGSRWSVVVTVPMLSAESDIGFGQRAGQHSCLGLTTGSEQRLEGVSGASGRAIRIDHRAGIYRTR